MIKYCAVLNVMFGGIMKKYSKDQYRWNITVEVDGQCDYDFEGKNTRENQDKKRKKYIDGHGTKCQQWLSQDC